MKKVLVLMAIGFEEVELVTSVDMLRRMEIEVDVASIYNLLEVSGSHGIVMIADVLFKDVNLDLYDMLVLPGGMPGTTNLADSLEVIDTIKYFNESKKWVAAICAAPIVLKKAGVIEGKNVTSFPGLEATFDGCNYLESSVVVDDNIITSRGAGTTALFAKKIGEVLEESDMAKIVYYAMLYGKY